MTMLKLMNLRLLPRFWIGWVSHTMSQAPIMSIICEKGEMKRWKSM